MRIIDCQSFALLYPLYGCLLIQFVSYRGPWASVLPRLTHRLMQSGASWGSSRQTVRRGQASLLNSCTNDAPHPQSAQEKKIINKDFPSCVCFAEISLRFRLCRERAAIRERARVERGGAARSRRRQGWETCPGYLPQRTWPTDAPRPELSAVDV